MLREPPANVQADRPAGVVTWFPAVPAARRKEGGPVAERTPDEAMPLAIVAIMGFVLPEQPGTQIRPTSLPPKTPPPAPQPAARHMMGWNAPLPGRQTDLFQLTPPGGRSETFAGAARPATNLYLGGAITPWGGIALDPSVLTEIPGTDSARWISTLASCSAACACKPFRCPTPPPKTAAPAAGASLMATVSTPLANSRQPTSVSGAAQTGVLKYRIPQTMSIVKPRWRPTG